MSGDYLEYEPDRHRSLSPLLAIKPRSTPSPERPPYEYLGGSLPPNVKLAPAIGQANFVLCKLLDPNRPDIAQQAREIELRADTDDDSDMEDEDMDSRSQTVEATPASSDLANARPPQTEVANVDLQATAQKALITSQGTAPPPSTKQQSNDHRDSVVEIDGQHRSGYDSERRASHAASTSALTNGTIPSVNGADSKESEGAFQVGSRSPNLTAKRNANGYDQQESLATSPNLAQLTIPPSKGSPSQKLAAFQPPPSPSLREGPAASPNQERKLPSFRHFSELADSARTEQQDPSRANGYPHRQSISSSTQSPTSAARQLSISSSRSPGSVYPASSPISAASETASRDIFLRSGQSGLTFLSTRRPSQASESGPYSATIHSASTTESYQSSDGLSPGTLVTPIEGRARHQSIDGALRILPPPNGPHIQHIPPHGAGGFKCDHPGCTALPFQTQYLLNSHANVHSQSRPHYCPVANCPRGEGGKGFKRKNEMIRHGLVHQSPGYVCPFCPDREHKYPRPDNLQRHVRVHHVDKDKDDAQLREVLAQRPEGGSRGRRRRTSS